MPYPQDPFLSTVGLTKTYWFDVNDTATPSSPISHAGGASDTYLTNNALGPFTDSYNPDGKSALWNATTNRFDFNSLKIGDIIEIRVDLLITNLAAQEIRLYMGFSEGVSSFEKSITHVYYKTAATNTPVTACFKLYIGNELVRTNPAFFRFESPQAAPIEVVGWFYAITSV
jgi:hypothetical protein